MIENKTECRNQAMEFIKCCTATANCNKCLRRGSKWTIKGVKGNPRRHAKESRGTWNSESAYHVSLLKVDILGRAEGRGGGGGQRLSERVEKKRTIISRDPFIESII